MSHHAQDVLESGFVMADTEPTTPGSRVWARRADAYNPPGPHQLWVLVTDPEHGPTWRSEMTGYETTWRNLLEVCVEHVAPAVRPLDVAARPKPPDWVTGSLQEIPADFDWDVLPRGYVGWRCRHCGQGRIFEGAVTVEMNEALTHEASCPSRAAVKIVDGHASHLLPCGCLPNDADAHRVGCPRYPDGKKG